MRFSKEGLLLFFKVLIFSFYMYFIKLPSFLCSVLFLGLGMGTCYDICLLLNFFPCFYLFVLNVLLCLCS